MMTRIGADEKESDLFLEEAVFHHLSERSEGRPLFIPPTWYRWIFWLLLVVLAGGLCWSSAVDVAVYAQVQAVVRLRPAHSLRPAFSGTVERVVVSPGRSIEGGEVIFRATSDEEAGEHPLRSPGAGFLARLTKLPGERFDRGESLGIVIPRTSQAELSLLVSERYRGRIRPGMPVLLLGDGHSGPIEARVTWVSEGLVEPRTVRRWLELSEEDLPGKSPLIVAGARLPSTATLDPSRLGLAHGLLIDAEVRLRTQPLLHSLISAFWTR